MVIKTESPTVKAALGSQQKLHCRFAVDHEQSNVSVEWIWQHRGERNTLFSYSRGSGRSQGDGVALKSLAGGDASYNIPLVKMTHEGTFVCSVSLNPIFTHLDLNLHVEGEIKTVWVFPYSSALKRLVLNRRDSSGTTMKVVLISSEPPRVSINVKGVLTLAEGAEHKVICDAGSYYPLDVEMVWYEQDPAASGQRVGAPLPKPLQNILLSSHKHNSDKTFSLSAFFYLKASLRDSGKQFTCSVSHKSLRVPIKKSFVLQVEGESD